MIINNNIPALNTHRQMGINQNAMQNSMEKLSSGMRINRAGDDAAGLAISEKMRAQINGLDQASRNAQDGISMIQTAEGALDETHSILQRMRELATQAANDTNVDVDREEIQKEMNELTSEINRIGNTTEFNTQNLLDGTRSSESITGSTDREIVASESIDVFTAEGVTSNGDGFNLSGSEFTIDNSYAGFDYSSVDDDETNTVQIGNNDGNLQVIITVHDGTDQAVFTDEFAPEFDEDGNFTYNNHGLSFTITEDEFNETASGDNIVIDLNEAADTATDVTGTFSTADSWTDNDGLATLAGNAINVDTDLLNSQFPSAASVQIEGNAAATEFTVTIFDGDDNELSSDVYTFGSAQTEFSYNNHGIEFAMEDIATEAIDGTFNLERETVTTNTFENNSANFQVGANQNQAINLSIGDMRAEALGISGTSDTLTFVNRDGDEETINLTSSSAVTDGTDAEGVERGLDVSSHENATKAITVINNAIESVSAERSMLGATQNRLEHTISNLDNASENLSAAESRIRDVDMAAEMMEMTRANILSQASQSMLAQANQQPQSVLQLLG